MRAYADTTLIDACQALSSRGSVCGGVNGGSKGGGGGVFGGVEGGVEGRGGAYAAHC